MQLIDKAVDVPGTHVLNMKTYEAILWQRRFMAAATFLAWIAVGLFITSLITTKWGSLEFHNVDYHEVKVELGVWGEYRTIKHWKNTTTEWIPHFPSPPEKILRLAGAGLHHYYRAQAAMGVIALLVLLSTNCLAMYTFYHHRYMFKRLCAGLYLVAGMCIFVTIEVLTSSVDEWNKEVVHSSQQKGEYWDYEMVMTLGYSTRLAQASIAICVFAFLSFAIGSHKQKGENAATSEFEIEDRPIHIGR